MSLITNLSVSSLGNALNTMLLAEEITPGDAPSYQLCKTIAAYHPLGAKMSDSPISMAQSQKRNITVPKGPEERLKEAFEAEWKALRADEHIFNVARLSRIYGVASIALLSQGVPADRPVQYDALYDASIGFNVFDPLNTAGSLVLNQQPNDIDFQKVKGISVQGQAYHRSRTVTLMNENPLYIEYTASAFGYVGRSVYQRALYPLKSFVQTMVTDDMVSVKAGVLIAKMKQPGSIIDSVMSSVGGQKRALLKEAQTNNVLSISTDEDIETLNLQNLDGAFGKAREDILENIATAADMPAIILNQETFAEGFGEGTEDAKRVVQFINRIREWMDPLYSWFDQIVMNRAWNPEFYKAIQRDYPEEYGSKGYRQAFYDWKNSFSALWPNLIEEPESEKIKVADVKLKAVIALLEVLLPNMDPDNRVKLIEWASDNFNELKELFGAPLVLDFEALEDFDPAEAALELQSKYGAPEEGGDKGGVEGVNKTPKPPKPFSDASRVRAALDGLTSAVDRLPSLNEERQRRRVANGA